MKLVVNGDDVGEKASEENIPRFLSAFVEDDTDSFIIMSCERGFIQAAKCKDGSFVLERQDGSADEHWVCSENELSREQLAFAFKSYFLADQSWIKQFSWERLELERNDDSPRQFDLKHWHMGVVLVVVLSFLIWSLVRTYA